MRSRRQFQPTFDLMPSRIAPSGLRHCHPHGCILVSWQLVHDHCKSDGHVLHSHPRIDHERPNTHSPGSFYVPISVNPNSTMVS